MRVSFSVQWICAAGLLMAACLCAAAAMAAETVAIEVEPAVEAVAAPDPAPTEAEPAEDAAPSEATEISLLELISWRQVGPPPLAVQPPSEEHTTAALLPAADDHVVGASLEGETEESVLEQLFDNQTYEGLRRRQSGRTDPAPALPARRPAARAPRAGWRIDGSVTLAPGYATYADADYVGFALRESLDLLSGDRYEFYQIYETEHSFVNAGLLTLGARQRLRDVAWRGDLRLKEEFRLYRDRDEGVYDRQEGLFELRFDPEWLCGCLEADIGYKYRIRVYETFSTRSYIYQGGRAELKYQLSPRVATRVLGRLDDYNYSQGSTLSSNRHAVGNEWQWEVVDGLQLSAGAARERKNYNLSKTRTYEKQGYEVGADWRIDADSSLRVKGKLVDYDRELRPESSYEDASLEVRYRRNLSDRLDAELRLRERQKDYDLGTASDLDQHSVDLRMNYNPTWDWNIYAGLGRTQYDYVNAARAFERRDAGVGVSYYMNRFSASADYFRREYVFDADADRDYARDDLNCYLDYRFGSQRWRVYYGIGMLGQTDPASVNEYSETRLGAAWDYELDPCVDLRLSYEYHVRDYDAYDDIEYGQLEARLEFEL